MKFLMADSNPFVGAPLYPIAAPMRAARAQFWFGRAISNPAGYPPTAEAQIGARRSAGGAKSAGCFPVLCRRHTANPSRSGAKRLPRDSRDDQAPLQLLLT